MAAQALYLKWRPMTFEEVVGQEHVTYTLRNAITTGRVAHAYLFTGPRGTGKTTMARLLAKATNCLADDPATRPCGQCRPCLMVNEGRFLDLIEIDAASHTSVDDVRELRDRISFSPNEGRYKVYIIDEVHRFSGAAFDALLKTIEEPPDHAIFVLATTEVHKVPQTILSRCQRFDFRRIPVWQIVERLWQITQEENLQVEQPVLELVARQATGSLRDAITLFDQLIAQPGEMLTLEMAQAILGTATSQAVQDLTGTLIAGDTAGGLDLINQTLDAGTDPRQFARQIVDYLRLVMVVQTGGTTLAEAVVMPDVLEAIAAQAQVFPRRALLEALRAFNTAAVEMRGGWQPQLPLELALLESIEALDVSPQPSLVSAPRQMVASPQAGPESQPAQAVQTVDAAGVDGPSLADIHARWRDVLAGVRQQDRAVEALLNSGRLYGVEGYIVVYQMPSDTLRGRIEKEENRAIVENVLQQLFGKPLKFTTRVQSAQSGDQTPEAEDLLANDSVVAFTVNELGGKIKRIRKSKE
ncbi:MAG: DNA polymerase III subunit gamma/tau [Anaerolineae bacterium]|nr:DNA polymerase III subunit gamma/tau [Anaerolineae bacterium]